VQFGFRVAFNAAVRQRLSALLHGEENGHSLSRAGRRIEVMTFSK